MIATERLYRPTIGQLVTLARYDLYTALGLDSFSRLRVLAVAETIVSARLAPAPLHPERDTQEVSVPLDYLEKPFGWEPRYIINAKPEEARRVIDDWFARGITIRANLDMGRDVGSKVFQPADNDSSPGWRYPDIVETVPAAECPRIFRVVAREHEQVTSLVGLARRAKDAQIQAIKASGWDDVYFEGHGHSGVWVKERGTILHDWEG